MDFREYYEKNAEEYAKNFGMVNTEILEIFLREVRPGGTILDLGCGLGQDVDYFSKRSFRATGVDISESMIRLAQRERLGVFFVGDMVCFSGTDTFDAVWSASALFTHLYKNERRKTLKNIHRLLLDGGVFGTIVRKKMKGKRKKGFFSYNTEEVVTELCEAGFVPEREHFFIQDGGSEWIGIISKKGTLTDSL